MSPMTRPTNGVVTIDPIEARTPCTNQFADVDVSTEFTMLVNRKATRNAPKTGHEYPRTRFHDRDSASVPRRPSTTSVGTETENRTAKMTPGMTNRMSPPNTASANSTPTSRIDHIRRYPNRYDSP